MGAPAVSYALPSLAILTAFMGRCAKSPRTVKTLLIRMETCIARTARLGCAACEALQAAWGTTLRAAGSEQQTPAKLPPCAQAANEKAMREHTMLMERTQKLSRELQEQIANNTRLLAESQAKAGCTLAHVPCKTPRLSQCWRYVTASASSQHTAVHPHAAGLHQSCRQQSPHIPSEPWTFIAGGEGRQRGCS